MLDELPVEPGAFYVMDRGYVDFKRLHSLTQSGAFFVVRARENMVYRRRYSHPVDKSTGLRCDQTIVLTGTHLDRKYPDPARLVRFVDAEKQLRLSLLTNQFVVPALTIAHLYKARWQVLQMDQAASSNQEVLWLFGQCCQDSNLDRHQHLCAGRHFEKATELAAQSLQNSTDSQPHVI